MRGRHLSRVTSFEAQQLRRITSCYPLVSYKRGSEPPFKGTKSRNLNTTSSRHRVFGSLVKMFTLHIPAAMPMPVPQASNKFGETRYKYVTPDGAVPNDGAVPSASPHNQPTPGLCGIPGIYGYPVAAHFPPPAGTGLYQYTPSPAPCYRYPHRTQSPAPNLAASFSGPPRPPPPAYHCFDRTNDDADEPLTGNRVNGKLATFPDKRAGYIFPRQNMTFHLFIDNVISKYPSFDGAITTRGDESKIEEVSCDMTLEELIEQIDCRKRANWHPPYNVPGHGYPEQLIGIQELLKVGDGRFTPGPKFMLTGPLARSKLRQIWPEAVSNTGQGRTIYIVRLPV